MRIRTLAMILFITAISAVSGVAGDDLFSAVRAGDSGRLKALLQGGADVNVRDDLGATPLMNAVALPGQDCVRVLLEAGADVNAATTAGMTALMWATGQVANVRLLIDHGADVNAKAKSGATALLTATRRANPEVLKLLLARGANPRAGTEDGSDLLKAAYPGVTNGARPNPEVVRILADAGVTLQSARQLGQAPLLAGLGDTRILNSILDAGANPNEVSSIPAQSIPILQLGVGSGDRDFVRTLIERGADPNGRSSRDVTALMIAVNATRPDPAMVRLLMEKGADLNARDKSGRTVLDWASMQGETGIVQMLRQAGALSGTGPSPAPPAISIPRTTRVAMERAIQQLQPIGPAFNKHSGCISCHNQSLPSIAVKLAGSRGVAVDGDLAQHPSKATLAFWGTQRGNLMNGLETGIGGFVENTTYGLWGLAEEGVPASSTTDAVIHRLLELQKADGSWQDFDVRPPLGGISPIKFTALGIRGVDTYAPPALKEEARARIARAREYLRKTTPEDTQDEAFRLLGLVWASAPSAEVTRQSHRVKALQRADGGWGQVPTMSSEAYSTGQAIYALRIAGLPNTDGAHRKGIAFLLRTQLEDGTWFVRSRAAVPIQAYFEAGFPHGTDQFISAAGTSWAVMALAGGL